MSHYQPPDMSWAGHFPLKIAPLCAGIWNPSNTWFLGPTRVHNPNGTSISSAVVAGLTIMTE